MRFKQLREVMMAPNWPITVLYGAIFALLGGALFWQIGSLVPGYSAAEAATYQSSLNLKALLDNPLNAPFLVAVKALTFIHIDSLLATRLIAAGGGIITLGTFAILVRRWHGMWTAVIGTLLFGLSAWFLHVARLGTPEVLLFGVFVLTAAGFWLRKTNHWLALLVCFLIVAGLLYVPGMVWFVVLGLLWQWKTIDAVFKKHLVTVTLGALLLFAALAPLALALFKDQSLIMPWLGLPEQWPAPLAMLENLLKVPFHLFIRNEANPSMWLGTAPILDVFSLTMFVLGGYVYLQNFRLLRTPLFIGLLTMTALLMALGSPISFTVIIPLVYLIIATGISRLIDLWLSVFPKNPIAKAVGWTILGIVVILACAYQITHYFIGWPDAAATHEIFTHQKP